MKSFALASLVGVLLFPAAAFADQAPRPTTAGVAPVSMYAMTKSAQATVRGSVTELGAAPFFGFTGSKGEGCPLRVEGRGAGTWY
jgi:hypothetical protein